jgi:hypothetical protein
VLILKCIELWCPWPENQYGVLHPILNLLYHHVAAWPEARLDFFGLASF